MPQVTKLYDSTPIVLFLEPKCCPFLFLTPHFFWFCKRHFFHEGHFSYNHELWSAAMMLNSHEPNQNNKSKAKACHWSIVLDTEMKFKFDILEVNLCLGTTNCNCFHVLLHVLTRLKRALYVMVFYMWTCFTILKTPLLYVHHLQKLSTMNILQLIFYRTWFLRFSPMNPPTPRHLHFSGVCLGMDLRMNFR